MKWTTTQDVQVTIADIANLFANASDEDQALFFVEVAKIMDRWIPSMKEMQLYYLAKHLKDCECSSDGARGFLKTISEGL